MISYIREICEAITKILRSIYKKSSIFNLKQKYIFAIKRYLCVIY